MLSDAKKRIAEVAMGVTQYNTPVTRMTGVDLASVAPGLFPVSVDPTVQPETAAEKMRHGAQVQRFINALTHAYDNGRLDFPEIADL